MDTRLSDDLDAIRLRVRGFVDDRVLPAEQRIFDEAQDGRADTLLGLQDAARAEGLWVPHLPAAYGGLGLGVIGMCALFREMGRSPVGARVFNCDAPDQGNMDLLLQAGSPAQRQRWLRPMADASITSAFCMTEPAPGAGADPTNLATTATHDPTLFGGRGGWRIDGHKWFSTGGRDASLLIVMARTSDDRKRGASMFLVERDQPGVEHLRDVPTMAPELLQHHESEFRLAGVTVPEDAVLGEIGEGFLLAQTRLVPARLTHCMRWLGWAARALHMCREYIATRQSMGRILARHQAIQQMIARNAVAIHQGNLMTWHCATLLAEGKDLTARTFSSMCKLHVARTLCQVLDDAIQMHGARGFSDDLPFALWYRLARAARIADGPDEVHQVVIARDFLLGRVELLG